MLENKCQQVGIWKGSRTHDRADFGDVPKDLMSKMNWLARHKEIYEFEAFVVETVSGVGFWQNGIEKHIVQ